jgi:hypothetical protein
MDYKEYIEKESRVSKSTVRPRNIYRISSYDYADKEARSLSGASSSLIFVIGMFDNKISCIKLNNVDTGVFKKWIKTILKGGLNATQVDKMNSLEEVLLRSDDTGNQFFDSNVKGTAIYNSNPRPYRTYNVDGLKYIQEVKLKKEFIKSLL